MNRFQVQWADSALDEFALWVDSADRATISLATDEIDQLLADNPQKSGQHIAEGVYKLRCGPLVAYYIPYSDPPRVEVTNVVLAS
jgi:hypothetical protein